MGYEMNLLLTVEPAEAFEAVAQAIEDRFGVQFESYEDGTGGLCHGRTTWSDMEDDMCALSSEMPDIAMSIQVDGDDDEEWINYYLNGMTYEESRPAWHPKPLDASKMKPHTPTV